MARSDTTVLSHVLATLFLGSLSCCLILDVKKDIGVMASANDEETVDDNPWLRDYEKKIVIPRERTTVFLVIIIPTEPEDKEIRDVIRNTWLKDEVDTMHYFTIGSQNLTKVFELSLETEHQKFKDLLLLPSMPNSLKDKTKKLMAASVYLSRNVKYEFLLKCDADVYVQLKDLRQELRNMSGTEIFHLGFFQGDRTPEKNDKNGEEIWNLCDRYFPFAMGAGFVLSSDLVDYIAANTHYLQVYNRDDIALSVWLAPLDIIRKHDMRFDTLPVSQGCLNNFLLTNNQNVTSMTEKYSQIQNTGLLCKTEMLKRWTYDYNWTGYPSRCCSFKMYTT